MIWKRRKKAKEPGTKTWKRIDQTPVPLGAGRIWLVDNDGESHAREPSAENLAALKALREAAGD